MKIGVFVNCLKVNAEEGVKAAAELGLSGIQFNAAKREYSPWQITPERKKNLKELSKRYNIALSAICGDMGGYGFEIAEDNPLRIAKTKEIIDLAANLGVKTVTAHIGVIPADEKHPRYDVMLKAISECGRHAAAANVTYAIETGPESAKVLKTFIDRTDGGVGVNLDPANFVMVTGQDPVEAVYLLKDYIVHTHLKDGKMLKPSDPEVVYDCFAKGGIEALNVADYFIETPVGQGDVDFPAYFAALNEIGYNGFLTIEREAGGNPVLDIQKAADYVRANCKFLD